MARLKNKNAFVTLLFILFSFSTFAQKSAELLVQANRATLERDYTKAIDLLLLIQRTLEATLIEEQQNTTQRCLQKV